MIRIRLSLLFALLFLVAIPTCTTLVPKLGAHDVSRIAELLVCMVCATAAVAELVQRRHDRSWPCKRLTWAAGIFILVAVLSVGMAAVPWAAARELALFLGLGSVVAAVARSTRAAEHEALAATVAGAALLNAALVMVVIVPVIAQAGTLDRYVVVPGYDNHRFFSHVQTVMLPLLLVAASRSFRGGAFARLAWAALILNLALLVFTQGRATGLGLLAAGLTSLLLFRHRAFQFARGLGLAALAGAALYLLIFVLVPHLMGSSADSAGNAGHLTNTQERAELWHLAWAYAKQQPWLGGGPMHFAHQPNPFGAHPHNIYLQLAAELGLPFALALTAWSAWALSHLARVICACKDPDQQAVGVALFATLVAIAVDGLFSGNFVMPVSQVWIAVAIGWAIAWTRSNPRSTEKTDAGSGARRLGWTISAATLIAQLWLWWSIAPEVRDLEHHLASASAAATVPVNIAPRFWSFGWF